MIFTMERARAASLLLFALASSQATESSFVTTSTLRTLLPELTASDSVARSCLSQRNPFRVVHHSPFIPPAIYSVSKPLSVARDVTSTSLPSASARERVTDLASFCMSPPPTKVAAVYTIFASDSTPRYVGLTRDVHRAISKHLATQPLDDCAFADIQVFYRPNRAAMTKVQQDWIASLGGTTVVVGNADSEHNTWANPPLSDAEAEKRLLLRQASADDSLRTDDPEAWSAVVRKSMKDGDDFEGSDAADKIEQSIESDEVATQSDLLRRASGDWKTEIDRQTLETIAAATTIDSKKPEWQTATLEMYSAPGCVHCERMRDMLSELGAAYKEFDVEDNTLEASTLTDDQKRRKRHALFNTVPQLYVLRTPPLHGLPAEWLVGGADDLAKELEIPEHSGFSFKSRIGDPKY